MTIRQFHMGDYPSIPVCSFWLNHYMDRLEHGRYHLYLGLRYDGKYVAVKMHRTLPAVPFDFQCIEQARPGKKQESEFLTPVKNKTFIITTWVLLDAFHTAL
jgi:hypothetical protein